MKKNKGKRFELGLRTLLNIGSSVAIIGVIFIGVFSILNLYKIKSRIDVVNTSAGEVSITVADVTKNLEEINAGSNKIGNGMSNIKSELEKNQEKVQPIKYDMQTLLVEPLSEVAGNLNTLMDGFKHLVSNYENSINRLRETQGATNLNIEVKSEVESNSDLNSVKEIISEAEKNLDDIKTNTLSKVSPFIDELLDSADTAETMGTSVIEVFSDSIRSVSLVTDNAVKDINSALEASSHAGVLAVESAVEIEEASKSINEISANSVQEAAKIGWIMIVVVCITTAAVVYMAFYTKSAITRPIISVVNMVKDIAEGEGDLTKRIVVNTRDEIGELAHRFNAFIEKLQDIISIVKNTAIKVNYSANEISTVIKEQESIASEQSSSVSEITSTMEEFSISSTQIADNSNKVVEVSDKAFEYAKNGAMAGENVMLNMEEISRDNQNSVNEIVELGKKSKEVTKVMEIINNIADQTKLIAFNAALEASSAGETGKRFAVVAGEIRRLADNVMESTSEIEGKIDEIQEAINRLLVNSENGTKRIAEGLNSAIKMAEIMENLVPGSESTNTAAKQISLSTQQQKTASSQVVIALKEIAEGAKQSFTTVTQTNSITNELTGLSNNLKDQVERFQLNNELKNEEDSQKVVSSRQKEVSSTISKGFSGLTIRNS